MASSIDLNGFLARRQPIPVEQAAAARRIAKSGVDIARFDADGSGAIDRVDEKVAYYSALRRTLGEPGTRAKDGAVVDPVAPVFEALGNLPPANTDGRDPFEPIVTLPTGRFAGERIDTSRNRSARLLSATEAARYGGRPGELVVANFRHDGRFWVIRIPADAVEAVTLQRLNFEAPVPAAHAQTRFTLRADRPAVLVPQAEGDTTPPQALRELVLSIEATSIRGQKYDIVEGMRGTFVNAYRLTSLEDRYRDSVTASHQTTQQFAVDADHETLNRILASGVSYATEKGMGEVYNTLWRNCSLGTFHYIDRAIGFDRRFTLWRGVYPVWIDGYMRHRGIYHDTNKLPNLEREFASAEALRARASLPVK